MNSIGSDTVPSISIDSAGNTYIAYQTTGTTSGGTYIGTSTTNADIVVFKMNTSGTVQWIRQQPIMNSSGSDSVPSISVDSSGNTYIAYQTTGIISGGTANGISSVRDIVVFKMDTSGNFHWILQQPIMNTNDWDMNPSICVDSSSNIFISYQTYSTVSGGTSVGNLDIVVMKLSVYPSAPLSLSTIYGDSQIVFSWSAPPTTGSTPLTGYILTDGVTPISLDSSTTSYTATGLTNGTPYTYQILSQNSNGDSYYISFISTTPSSTPPAPTNLRALPGNKQITFSWSPLPYSTPITGYTLTNGTLSYTLDSNTTTYTVPNLTNSTTYTFQVAAINANGTGSYAPFTPAIPCIIPSFQLIRQQPVMNSSDINMLPSIDKDSFGNIYVAYQTSGTSSGGTLSGSYDIVLFKMNSSGTLLWIQQQPLMNSSGSDNNISLSVDSAGNAYVAYQTSGTISGGTFSGTSSSNNDIVVFKMDTNGALLWIQQQPVMNTSSNDLNPSISVDSTGNAYVSYQTYGTTSGGTLIGPSFRIDIVVFKMDTSGTVQWIRQQPVMNSTDWDINSSICVDSSSNIYVAYESYSTVSGGTHLGALGSSTNIVVFKMNSQGTLLWIKGEPVMNTSFLDSFPSISVDSAGNTYVAYQTTGTTSGGTASGSNDIIVFKMDTNGSLQWIRQQPLMNSIGSDTAPSIKVSSSGNIYVSYQTYGTTFGGTLTTPQDIVVFKLNILGNLDWIKQEPNMNTTSSDYTSKILVDASENIFVTYFTGGTTSGGTNFSGNDIVVFKLSPYPSEPSIVSITPGNHQITLVWDYPSFDAGYEITSFNIYDSSTLLYTYTVEETPTEPFTYTLTELTNGQEYSISMSAISDAGEGVTTIPVSITPRTVPSAPRSLTGTAGFEQVQVQWTSPLSNGGASITSYNIYYYTSDPSSPTLATTLTDLSSLSYTITGLTNTTLYYIYVKAVNEAGESVASNIIQKTPYTVPDAPTIGTATSGNRSISITWTAPASNGGSAITAYKIYNNADDTLMATAPSNLTSATIGGLTNGTEYVVYVKAQNAAGLSSKSGTVSATPNNSNFIPCFFADAKVLTPNGYIPIGQLKKGDSVKTGYGNVVQIKEVVITNVPASSTSNPYIIPKGTLGAKVDLPISPNHRVLIPGKGMIEARHLGLKQVEMEGSLEYYNLVLPNYNTDRMVVEGVEVESMVPPKKVTKVSMTK